MSALKLMAILMLSSIFSVFNSASADQDFGGGADMAQLSAISEILTSPSDFMSSPVTVEGTIVKVCKKRGCWMELASDKKFQTLRIKVRDGEMVFPMTAMGKVAYATGKLTATPLNLTQTKNYLAHIAQEQQESFDANEVTKAITVYQLSPTGVTIED